MTAKNRKKCLSDFFPAKSNYVNYLINWSQQLKIIYVETPKVGCTTIKQILQYAEYGFDISKVPTEDHDHLHDRARSPLKSPGYNEEQFLICL
ncbi:MAG: hypothetical protein DRR06_17035, partial [Gammaproteobacteria bacterium]